MSDCPYVPMADEPQPMTVGHYATIVIWSPDSVKGRQIQPAAMKGILSMRYPTFELTDGVVQGSKGYIIRGEQMVDWDEVGMDFKKKTDSIVLQPTSEETLAGIEDMLTDGDTAIIRNPEQEIKYEAGTSDMYNLNELKQAMSEFKEYGFESLLFVPVLGKDYRKKTDEDFVGSISGKIVATSGILKLIEESHKFD